MEKNITFLFLSFCMRSQFSGIFGKLTYIFRRKIVSVSFNSRYCGSPSITDLSNQAQRRSRVIEYASIATRKGPPVMSALVAAPQSGWSGLSPTKTCLSPTEIFLKIFEWNDYFRTIHLIIQFVLRQEVSFYFLNWLFNENHGMVANQRKINKRKDFKLMVRV